VPEPSTFETESFEWRPAGGGACVVMLTGHWRAGEEPPGRAALVAERSGTLLAVAPLPSAGAGGAPVVAALSLPADRVDDEGVRFLLKAEGRSVISLDRPAQGSADGDGAVSAGEGADGARSDAHEEVGGAAREDRGAPSATGFVEAEGGEGARPKSAERRIRDLERDLERERTARASLEQALAAAADTKEKLVQARGEKEDLETQLETVEAERDRLAQELAAASRSAREWASLARTREEELAGARGEIEGSLRQLDAAVQEADELRGSLSAEQEARSGAEQNARTARKERDAAIERARTQLAGMVEAAVARDLERELAAAREVVAQERAARETAEAELGQARVARETTESELMRERGAREAAEAKLVEARAALESDHPELARERSEREAAEAALARERERTRSLADSFGRTRAEREGELVALTEVESELERLAATARELLDSAAAVGGDGGARAPEQELIEGALREVRRGRQEAAALEQRVAELRAALLESGP
jgi:hypothetical protein